MKREIITISDNGVVSMPRVSVALFKMRDFEIAELFEVMLPTVRAKIKRLLKSRINLACDKTGGVVSGNVIIPEYFGLEVIIAIAFQVDSFKADIFRKYIVNRATTSSHIYIQLHDGGGDNHLS